MSRPPTLRSLGAASTLLVAAIAACAPDRPLTAPPPAPPEAASGGTPAAAAPSFSRPEGYRTPGELREGYVLDRAGKPMFVRYEVHDGLAIWEGDIVLGRADQVATTKIGARPFMRSGPKLSRSPLGGPQTTVIIDGDNYRWPGGVVPYEIAAGIGNTQRFTDAIAKIEETTGGITIVPRSGQSDYIKFVNTGDGCSSPIGRQGGEQQIQIADDCSAGNIAHEIMHSLSMFHEQTRCDRDTYVEILFDNVEDGKENNFDKQCDGATDLGDNYDFGSMMHYSLMSFSKNGQPTIRLRPGVTTTETIGQRTALSVLDRFTLNYLYGLNNIPPVPRIAAFAASYDEGSGVPMDATGSTDADDKKLTYRWNFGDGSCFAFPQPADCTQDKPSHVYKNDGVYKVGLFVFDGYEEEATEQYVTIRNVKPDVDWIAGFFGLLDEGEEMTQSGGFTDPGDDYWSATVDYGDGGGAQALTLVGKTFSLTHTYADNGNYTAKVSVTDDDETGSQSKSIQVRNVAPKVDAGADKTFTSGQTFNFAGTFSDKGVNDSPWAWSIDWGAGTPTTGSATAQGAITASNRVCGAGTYAVILSVTDKDGGSGRDTAQVTVGYVAVGLSIQPGSNPSPIALKKQGTFPVAILSSPTFDARTIDVASLRIGNEVGADAQVAMLKGKYQATIQDVNGDGRLDLMAQVSVPDLVATGDLTVATTSLVVRGKQGPPGDPCINFRGVGAVKVN